MKTKKEKEKEEIKKKLKKFFSKQKICKHIRDNNPDKFYLQEYVATKYGLPKDISLYLAPAYTQTGDIIEKKIAELKNMGFVVSEMGNLGRKWILKKDNWTFSYICPREIKMVNGRYISFNLSDIGENLAEKVKEIMDEWEETQEEMNILRTEISKMKQMAKVSNLSVKGAIEGVAAENGFEYASYKKIGRHINEHGKDEYLAIKMSNRRYLEIKIPMVIETEILRKLPECIVNLEKAMEAFGSLKVSVNTYGNNIEWKRGKEEEE